MWVSWVYHGPLIAFPGELYIGGQEHFYLETNCTIAVPKGEAGEMELFVGTQNTMKTQVCNLRSVEALGW
jgi:xanthine dehydrogenase/oxidase